MKALFHFLFKRFSPINYARWLDVNVGSDCRLIKVTFSAKPWLVTLGDHVSATAAHFETHDGGVWVLRHDNPELDIVKPITVGNNVFIGYGALILLGVTIGNNFVIDAHSVIARDIPDNCVAVSIPARVIKDMDAYKNKAYATGDNTKSMSSADKKSFYLKKYL